jgi:colanic acid biosynthesis glycosyl transferase WcaI
MKILLITQWFQPEPIFKGLPFAKKLKELGHEVQVLTGFPNHPYGKIYPGYSMRFIQREDVEGVSVIRVPLYPSRDRSSIRRFLSYISFGLSATIIGLWAIKRPDVVYVYHPPPTSCLPACLLRLFRGIPFVYDIQDLWPDSLLESGMFKNKFGIWLAGEACKMLYRMTNKIVVLSPGFKEELCCRGVKADKIEVIYNWCSESNIGSADKRQQLAAELGMSGKFNVMFAGNLGNVQMLDTLIDAAAIVQYQHPDVQFVLIGSGSEEDMLKAKVRQMQLKNVVFHGRRPMCEIDSIMAMSEVLFVQLKDTPTFRITIPSKTQNYLAVGRPILVGVEGNVTELILRANAGIKCKPGDPKSISEAITKFKSMSKEELDEMGQNGRRFYQEHLSLEVGVKHFIDVFQSIVK